MTAEITTYERLGLTEDTGLPRLYAHGQFDNPAEEASACGWAVYSRIFGEALSFAILKNLTPDERARFVHDVVGEAISLETRLNAVEPLPSWNDNYSDVRIKRLRKWRDENGKISITDLALAEEVNAFIQRERKTWRYIHGDFNPPNIMADFARMAWAGSIVKFVDPMISYDAPESNWRHLTLFPDLAEAIAHEYSRRTNTPTNHRLMYAIGAFTHLYNALAEPQQAAFRQPALIRCLEKVGITT